jgi:hypothetical protein
MVSGANPTSELLDPPDSPIARDNRMDPPNATPKNTGSGEGPGERFLEADTLLDLANSPNSVDSYKELVINVSILTQPKILVLVQIAEVHASL